MSSLFLTYVPGVFFLKACITLLRIGYKTYKGVFTAPAFLFVRFALFPPHSSRSQAGFS